MDKKTQMVKFYAMKPRMASHEVILELYMNTSIDAIDGGALSPQGEMLLEDISNGNIYVDGIVLTFADKEFYLRNLHKAFDTPYLTASQYIPQESSLPPVPEV
jgi:hypothetical protein